MPQIQAYIMVFVGVGFLASCGNGPSRDEVERALNALSSDETVTPYEAIHALADPLEAVSLFEVAAAKNPERIEGLRDLAIELSKISQTDRLIAAWKRVVSHPLSSNEDRVNLGQSLVRAGKWMEAEAALASVPDSHQTFKRYQLAAILSDNRKKWKEADAFYKSAVDLSPNSAMIHNNWGYSYLSREDFKEAERLFLRSLSYDPTLFIAKNNLALARAGQRNYQLPTVEMTQQERAQLLYTMGLAAIKLGDTHSGKVLLREAIDSHPRHFEEAVRSLRTIEGR